MATGFSLSPPPKKMSDRGFPETRAGRVIRFIESYCLVPEGKLVGKPIVLAPFQRKFIIDVYNNPHGTRHAILSMARKNAKSATIACLVLAHIVGPERVLNAQLVVGALSREQASLVFNLCVKMLQMQVKFAGLYRISTKRILGLKANTEFKPLAAEGSTTHGLSPLVAILDEVGQIKGPTNPFVEAILTSQGAYDNPLTIMISTQAANDADFLSLRIDDALRSGDPHTVCHVYAADPECDLLDREQWKKANPALGLFRAEKDLEEQLKQAARIPALEASSRNLLLNQRIGRETLWLAPEVWKSCAFPVSLETFQNATFVSLGLDLSTRNDLTAAVLSAKTDVGTIELMPFVFTPQKGLKGRELRDKAPYSTWVKNGFLIEVPGATLDYDWLFEWLKIRLDADGIPVHRISFDRWRIKEAKAAAERAGFAPDAEWVEVGQGYVGMSPRIEHFETYLLQGTMSHGGHPLLNMAAANAIVVRDPAGNRKLDKSKTTQRIDPLQAAVMSVGAFMEAAEQPFDVKAWIG